MKCYSLKRKNRSCSINACSLNGHYFHINNGPIIQFAPLSFCSFVLTFNSIQSTSTDLNIETANQLTSLWHHSARFCHHFNFDANYYRRNRIYCTSLGFSTRSNFRFSSNCRQGTIQMTSEFILQMFVRTHIMKKIYVNQTRRTSIGCRALRYRIS